jgi:hypothetical protein
LRTALRLSRASVYSSPSRYSPSTIAQRRVTRAAAPWHGGLGGDDDGGGATGAYVQPGCYNRLGCMCVHRHALGEVDRRRN